MRIWIVIIIVVVAAWAVSANANPSTQETVSQQLSKMKQQCPSCAVAMRDYALIMRKSCRQTISPSWFSQAFQRSPMVTAMITVHNMDSGMYNQQFMPIVVKNIDCNSSANWLDKTRREYTLRYSGG